MRKIITSFVVGAFILSGSLLADEKKIESSADTSRNPITGTVTKTSKYHKKSKHKDGSEKETTVKETTKIKKDGTVDSKTETENTSVPAKSE